MIRPSSIVGHSQKQPVDAHGSERRAHRLLALGSAVLMLAFWVLMQHLDPTAYDPLWLRLVLSGLGVAGFLFTYTPFATPRAVEASRLVVRYGFALFFLFLMGANTGSEAYSLLTITAVLSMALLPNTRAHAYGYASGVFVAVAFIYALHPEAYFEAQTILPVFFLALVVTGMAMHARLNLTKALRQSEMHLRGLFERSTAGLVLLDTGMGTIIQANDFALHLLGLAPNESDRLVALLQTLHASSPKGRTLEQYLPGAGTTPGRWVQIDFHPFIGEQKDELMLVSLNDISARKQSEQEVIEQRNTAERYLDVAGAIILALDVEGHITRLNRAGCQLLGVAEADVLGREWFSFVSTQKTVRERFRAVMANDSAFARGFENWIDTPSGKRLVNWNGIVLRDANGTPTGSLHSGTDVTERHFSHIALQHSKNEALAIAQHKADTLAVMSHEIRTPMNGVIGMAGLLLETELNAEQREFANVINTCGDALLTIVNDILDLSKLEAGKVNFDEKPFSVERTLEEVFDLLAPRAKEKNLELLYYVDANMPAMLVGDAGRVRQILINLVNNAVKFTKEGEIVIKVSARDAVDTKGAPTGKQHITFAIRDTGMGISEAAAARIFKPYEQAPAEGTGSSHRTIEGTGLGLSISSKLARLMNGNLSLAWSKPNVGSEFIFEAVLEPVPHDLVQEQAPLLPLRLQGIRALVVDDNPTNRNILALQLAKWGMVPTLAADGAEALKLATTQDFDIALLDFQMPFMDGVTLAKTLRNLSGGCLPMLLLSSLMRTEIPAGLFTAMLSKPVKNTALLGAIAEALQVAAPLPPKPLEADASEAMSLSGTFALVADDNPVNRKLLVKLLSRFGMATAEAVTGSEALAMMRQQAFDLVFMDMHMPEMDGLEATRTIMAELPEGKRPIVVATTASTLQEDRDACFAAGMNDFLPKPIVASALHAMLRRWSNRLPQRTALADAPANALKPANALIDETVLDNLAQLQDTGFMVQLFEMFTNKANRQLAELEQALAHGNRSALETVSHSLLGGCLNVGAKAMGRLCGVVNAHAKTAPLSELELLVAELHAALPPALLAVKAYAHGLEQHRQN